MKLNDFYQTLEMVAPKRLSNEYCEKYGAYDNSGVLLETGDEIVGVVFSLDFSQKAIDKAIETGANLIVTHHPAIYGKISEICVSNFSPISEKIMKCLQNKISVISMHLNLDCAQGGIDESLMQGILCATGSPRTDFVLMHTLSQGGYGRVYQTRKTYFTDFAESLKKQFNTERMSVYANGKRTIKKVASFCGAGADEESVQFAVEQGADVIVSADFKHHVLALANEKNIAVVALTHYASEQYGFKEFYKKISQKVDLPCVYHTDETLF